MTICVIPARSNSKRIKNKNIINFFGKPLIYYSIEAAKKSNLFKRIIVSTDSEKIANIAVKFGAEVPFLRSKKLSNDFVTTTDVIRDCVKNISSEKVPYHFCIYPTSIFIKKKDLRAAFKKIKKTKNDLLISVSEFNSSPHRALKLVKNERIDFISHKYANSRSQDLPVLFHDAGSFYIYKTDSLLKRKKKLPKRTTFFNINRLDFLDINDQVDIELAKIQFQYLKKIKKNK